jgi:hypothetical protein
MKRAAVLIFVFALLLSSAAYAEDGFKLAIGYQAMYRDMPIDIRDAGMSGTSVTGLSADFKLDGMMHAPFVSIGYEQGPLFTRFMFDYNISSGGKLKIKSLPYDAMSYLDRTSLKVDAEMWKLEGNIGYKVYDHNNIALTPYLGFGYRNSSATLKESPSDYVSISEIPADVTVEHKTPYVSFGVIAKYSQPVWSVGLDVAALVSFAGKVSACYDNVCISANNDVGAGVRAMIPVTYTLVPKKGNKVGVELFVTPFFEYLSSDTSIALNVGGPGPITGKINLNDYSYGGKFGVGFTF